MTSTTAHGPRSRRHWSPSSVSGTPSAHPPPPCPPRIRPRRRPRAPPQSRPPRAIGPSPNTSLTRSIGSRRRCGPLPTAASAVTASWRPSRQNTAGTAASGIPGTAPPAPFYTVLGSAAHDPWAVHAPGNLLRALAAQLGDKPPDSPRTAALSGTKPLPPLAELLVKVAQHPQHVLAPLARSSTRPRATGVSGAAASKLMGAWRRETVIPYTDLVPLPDASTQGVRDPRLSAAAGSGGGGAAAGLTPPAARAFRRHFLLSVELLQADLTLLSSTIRFLHNNRPPPDVRMYFGLFNDIYRFLTSSELFLQWRSVKALFRAGTSAAPSRHRSFRQSVPPPPTTPASAGHLPPPSGQVGAQAAEDDLSQFISSGHQPANPWDDPGSPASGALHGSDHDDDDDDDDDDSDDSDDSDASSSEDGGSSTSAQQTMLGLQQLTVGLLRSGGVLPVGSVATSGSAAAASATTRKKTGPWPADAAEPIPDLVDVLANELNRTAQQVPWLPSPFFAALFLLSPHVSPAQLSTIVERYHKQARPPAEPALSSAQSTVISLLAPRLNDNLTAASLPGAAQLLRVIADAFKRS